MNPPDLSGITEAWTVVGVVEHDYGDSTIYVGEPNDGDSRPDLDEAFKSLVDQRVRVTIERLGPEWSCSMCRDTGLIEYVTSPGFSRGNYPCWGEAHR